MILSSPLRRFLENVGSISLSFRKDLEAGGVGILCDSGLPGSSFRIRWAYLGAFGRYLGAFRNPCRFVKTSWGLLGHSLGALGGCLVDPGASLGAPWAPLGLNLRPPVLPKVPPWSPLAIPVGAPRGVLGLLVTFLVAA